MDNQNNIQDELRSLNSGLPVNNSPDPFSVPEGYFNGLAAQVLAKVKGRELSAAEELQGLSPLLAGLSKHSPYAVPDGYFAENMALLPFLLKEEESPVLAGISKKVPYMVPDGYFEQVPQQILSTLARPKAKLVPFFSRTWMKAAVAAMIGGIIFLGGYRLLHNPEETMPADMAKQSADTTRNLVAKNRTIVTQEMKNISTEELDEFMKTVPYQAAKKQKSAFQPKQEKDIEELLKDVSQKEIDAFLDAIPTADENLMVID